MQNKLKIVAIVPRDGWAIIEEEGKLFLLHPPYTVSAKSECSPVELQEAVLKHGFHSVDYPFRDYAGLITFIKEEIIRSNKAAHASVPTDEELKELLKYANDKILTHFLQKAEDELIPEGNIEAAESLALDLLKLDKVKENKMLLNQALSIIAKCKEERNLKKVWEMKFHEKRLKSKFTYISEKYRPENILELIKNTRDQRMVFSVA